MREIQQIKSLLRHVWDARKEKGVTKGNEKRDGVWCRRKGRIKKTLNQAKERRRSEGGGRERNTVKKVEKGGQGKRKGNWISFNLFRAQQASSLSLSSYLLGYWLSSGLALFLNSFSPFFLIVYLCPSLFSLSFDSRLSFFIAYPYHTFAKLDSPLRRNEGSRGFSLMTFFESHIEIFSYSIKKKFMP